MRGGREEGASEGREGGRGREEGGEGGRGGMTVIHTRQVTRAKPREEPRLSTG